MKKIIKITMSLLAVLGLAVFAHGASAAYSINSLHADCPNNGVGHTVAIGNYTTGFGIADPCWTASSITANVGEVINVAIYYHNSGTTPANNVSFQISDLTNQTIASNGTVSFTGKILVGGSVVKQETVTLRVSGGPSKLLFGQVGVYTQGTGQNNIVSNGQSIITSGGYQFGTLNTGWSNQGVIQASFKIVDDAPVIQCQAPTITTVLGSALDDANGSITLNGQFNANGYATTTSFQYRTAGGSWTTVGSQNRGVSNGSFNFRLTGLAPDNYEFRAVAQNCGGTVEGAPIAFVIHGGVTCPAGTHLSGNVCVPDVVNCPVGTHLVGNVCVPDQTCNTCGCIGYPQCYSQLSVQTLSAIVNNNNNNYNNTSATLQGDVVSGATSNTSVYFKWGTSTYNLYNTLNAGTVNSNTNFSQTLSNLSTNTTYYYKACATNNNQGEVCGQTLSFTTQNNTNCGYGYYYNGNTCVPNVQNCPTGYYLSGNTCIPIVQTCNAGFYLVGNTCVPIIVQNTLPSVTTLGTISVGGNIAVIDGYYSANGCTVNTYFNYGTTQSLGSTTGSVNRGTGSGSMAQSISGLSAGTTYYYQAVAQNCAGTATGAIMSFTTTRTTVNDTNVTYVYRTITNNVGGGGSSFITLTITNNRQVVMQGDQTSYDITWKNISGKTLKDLVLQVNFPAQMVIVNPGQGSVEPKKSSVIYHINTLNANDDGEMTITGTINSGVKAGEPVVAQAVMAFQNPTSNATENAIAYDADTFAIGGAVLGASIFGLGFLPTSLGGWLIILLIILLIIIVAHYYFVGRRNNVVVQDFSQRGPVNPPINHTEPGAPGTGDYIVYRPMPMNQPKP